MPTSCSTSYLFHFNPGRAKGNANVSLSFNEESAISFDKLPSEILSAKWMDSNVDIPFEQTDDTAKFNFIGYHYGRSLCLRVAEIKFK